MVLGRDIDPSRKYLFNDSPVPSEFLICQHPKVIFNAENYLLYIITNLNPEQTTIPNYFKSLNIQNQRNNLLKNFIALFAIHSNNEG